MNFITKVKKFFCSHQWDYWHAEIIDGKSTYFIFNRYRKCQRCQKQQRKNLLPHSGSTNSNPPRWISSIIDLDSSSKVIKSKAKELGSKKVK